MLEKISAALCEMINSFNSNQVIAIFTILITAILAFATWKSAKATEKSAKATERLIEIQYTPYVIVYTKMSSFSFQLISLVIENIGTAPAFDIKFDIPEYFPWAAGGIEKEHTLKPKNLVSGPLINGMKNLAPKEKWESIWGQYGSLLVGLEDQPIIINVNYKDYRGNDIISSYCLDIHDFDSAMKLDNEKSSIASSIVEANKILKQISDNLIKKVDSKNAEHILLSSLLALELLNPQDKRERIKYVMDKLGASQVQLRDVQNKVIEVLKEEEKHNPLAKSTLERIQAEKLYENK